MTKKTIALIPVSPADRSAFVAAIQEAFSAALKNHFPITEPFPPEKEINHTLNTAGTEAYYALCNAEKCGGAVVQYDATCKRAFLELFFISPKLQRKGMGQLVWQTLEKHYLQAKAWELVTPYFEKRNIHFYLNKCGFKIVEFVNKHHFPLNPRYQLSEGENPLGRDEFFRFEKIIKP